MSDEDAFEFYLRGAQHEDASAQMEGRAFW